MSEPSPTLRIETNFALSEWVSKLMENYAQIQSDGVTVNTYVRVPYSYLHKLVIKGRSELMKWPELLFIVYDEQSGETLFDAKGIFQAQC